VIVSGGAARRFTLTLIVLLIVLLSACGDQVPGDRLLVASGFTDQVFVLDALTGTVLDSLALDRRPGERDEPHGIAVSPDGRHFYVTLSHGEPSLWKYESDGLRLVGRVTLPTHGASRVRLSPDGTTAAVPDYWLSGGGQVSRVAFVRTRDLSILDAPEVCAAPHDAAFSPDGELIAVACTGDDRVIVMSADGYDVLGAVGMGIGDKPMNAAWTPDGARVVVTLASRSALADIKIGAGARDGGHGPVGPVGPVAFRSTESGAAQLEMSHGRMVVANRAAGTVSIRSLGGGEARSVQMPGANPHGVALGSNGRTAFITYEGDTQSRGGVVAIDVETGTLIWHAEVGVFTLGVAVLPGGGRRSPS